MKQNWQPTTLTFFLASLVSLPLMGTPLVTAGFDDLSLGNVVGQGGGSGLSGTWASSGPYEVVSGGLSYTVSGGGIIDGGTQALQTTGTGDYLTRTIDGSVSLNQTIYIRYLARATGGVGDNEYFHQYNSSSTWDTYSAAKVAADSLENRIGNGANAAVAQTIDTGETYLFVDKLTYDMGLSQWNVMSSWVNPGVGDEGSPDTSHNDGTLAPGSFTELQFRMQNDTAILDEYLIGTTWNDVVPIPEPGVVGLLGIGGLLVMWHRRRKKA